MSEFLMIVPEGWSELVDGQAFVDKYTEAQLLDLLSYGNFASIEAMLQDEGFIAATASMQDFRMFKDGGTYRIWYRLG